MDALQIMYNKNLTVAQVEKVVEDWYSDYRTKDIGVIQSTTGFDLEEIVQNFDNPYYCNINVIKKHKLTEDEILTLVLFWYLEIYLPFGQDFGTIETELRKQDINAFYGENIAKMNEHLDSDENIELDDYINLEHQRIEESKKINNEIIKLAKFPKINLN